MCAVVCSLFRIDYEIQDDSQSERFMRRHYSGKRPMTIDDHPGYTQSMRDHENLLLIFAVSMELGSSKLEYKQLSCYHAV
jgi:hypothetical protein